MKRNQNYILNKLYKQELDKMYINFRKSRKFKIYENIYLNIQKIL